LAPNLASKVQFEGLPPEKTTEACILPCITVHMSTAKLAYFRIHNRQSFDQDKLIHQSIPQDQSVSLIVKVTA
jgi:hypothetical protein